MNPVNIDTDKLARLARLSIGDSERARLEVDLAELIGFAAECRASLETDDGRRKAVDGFAPLRGDLPRESLDRELLLANSPDKNGADRKYFTTPRVIES